uniref:Uncharacterized protein n=1 Tax=Heterorhabditis bacteriophora TaxID=37862 RepID=A0A1I7WRW1_HETBA
MNLTFLNFKKISTHDLRTGSHSITFHDSSRLRTTFS